MDRPDSAIPLKRLSRHGTRKRTSVHIKRTPAGYNRMHEGSASGAEDMSAADVSEFQTAMGGMGLEIGSAPEASMADRPVMTRSLSENDSPPLIYAAATHDSATEGMQFVPGTEAVPLTDPRYLAPISGARLGDDLHQVETGLGISRPRSNLSATSSLTRAGTLMRKASQRVVNLTNDSEMVEQSLRDEGHDARLQEPPTLPAMQDHSFGEKQLYSPAIGERQNPLRGKTLGFFGPQNPLRRKLCDMMVHPYTEPLILILIIVQTVILTIDAAPTVALGERPGPWRSTWSDFALLALFLLYSLEIVARIIVSGFVRNAAEYSTVSVSANYRAKLQERVGHFFGPSQRKGFDPNPSVVKTFTNVQNPLQPVYERQRLRLAQRAFLRHGFNRLDFVAVVSYWIAFSLAVLDIAPEKHIYVFKMLSCLRIVRLLSLTSGTSVILRSLKKAAPSLVNVAFLIGFFWLLFAIVGVQSFKSSFRRTCVWYEDLGLTMQQAKAGVPLTGFNYTQNIAPANLQFCGGHTDLQSSKPMPWLKANLLQNGTGRHKGFLCPRGSLCVEGQNPYLGTVSFDNILHSLQLIFVIMSANTFSELLYYTTNSDLLAAALFFAFGIVVLSFWLMNLLVAVITSSFQVIREESKTSAFTVDEDPHLAMDDEAQERKPSRLQRMYDATYWLWIAVIVYDILMMCLRSAKMGSQRESLVDGSETAVTFILFFEILLRLVTSWRTFHRSKRNWVDLSIAVITMVLQLPPIHDSGEPYEWLTVFQILRIYRVVLAVPITRNLLITVLGNASGLLNLIVFVFLVTFLTAIFAVQIFRGEFPSTDSSGNTVRITFGNIYNGFIGMYQVLSSENWTILMYNSTQYDDKWHTSWISATFFILWFILANFIVINMFIAVIQENFDVTEDEKRLQQVKAFLQQKELGSMTHSNLSLSTIFRFGKSSLRQRDPLEYGPATLDMLLQETIFRDFLDQQRESLPAEVPRKPHLLQRWATEARARVFGQEPNPFYSRMQPESSTGGTDIRSQARRIVSAAEVRRRAQRQYLEKYPTYNISLFLFPPTSKIRRCCQRIVGPGHGYSRIEGVDPLKPVWYAFSAFIYAAVVAMVLLACVTTPLYQREYFRRHGGYTSRNWFVWTDAGFAIIFTLEAVIKVVADGFIWTPNAYFRGTWGFIDGLVLVTLWINVITSLHKDGAVSRAVGAFKALRALRLLHVSDSARDTFNSVIILGGWKVVSAALVSLSLLFPFAIYGLNLFNGKMRNCNDPSISDLAECVGEFAGSPFYWNIISPRRAANPYYSFDNFGSAMSILFQIVSQEGWTDVMWTAMSITGRGQGTSTLASPGNAIFFIIFNLLGAVFVLTLFVSVFMRNYTEQTGVAFLTADQRSWLELRKLLRQVSPSKRPAHDANTGWRTWCYRIAVKKRGRWSRFITGVLCVQLLLLMLEFYPEPMWWQRLRDALLLLFTMSYAANVVIRIVGLSWKRFSRSSWDLYSVITIVGAVVTTVLDLSAYSDVVFTQLHKFFFAATTLLLIPRNNQLDQLFKTAAASFPAIANLLATWFVLFLVYAIALTQAFGLTRFGNMANGNLNFRNVPKALILLFRTSIGEGWNQIMEDFATITYPNCVVGPQFYDGDCGGAAWARLLFISWNIVSMYIFVNLFVSLIFESFSYVYQRSGGATIINRDEIRRFKQAWATFDPAGTGYIARDTFPRLLGELSGVFAMSIYAGGDHSVHRILENCALSPGDSSKTPGAAYGINLAEMNRQLRIIDVDVIRRRRARMEVFYQEIMVSADPSRGVSFTSCLMILAHYNVITDSKSLRLEEFLRRRARLQRVEEEVRRRIVKGFFDMMFWVRRFRARHQQRQSARMVTVPQFAVPEIFIDEDFDEHGPSEPERRLSFEEESAHLRQELNSRLSGQHSDHSPQTSPRLGSLSPVNHSPSLRTSRSSSSEAGHEWDQASDHSVDGLGTAQSMGRNRATSSVERSNVLEVFDNSAWGESMRRSFTERRNGSRSHSRSRS